MLCLFRFYFVSVLLFPALSSTQEVSITDDLGRRIELPSPAQRIVSLAPSITESLFAIGAGDQVVGVTTYCNYPPAALKKPKVGGIVNPSIEEIVGLRPDLIILSMEGNVRDDFEKLTSFGIPVFVSNPRSLGGIHRSVEQLGRLTGREARAHQVVAAMQSREDSITNAARQAPVQRVLFFVSLQPLIVVGARTFLNELIERAGGTNPAAATVSTFPAYSREAVLSVDPDTIVMMSGLIDQPRDVQMLYPEWAQLRAVRAGRVYQIDADIVSRPGPRAVDALDALYHLLHRQTK
jgi:iron complex transport system substrate-binding protein